MQKRPKYNEVEEEDNNKYISIPRYVGGRCKYREDKNCFIKIVVKLKIFLIYFVIVYIIFGK